MTRVIRCPSWNTCNFSPECELAGAEAGGACDTIVVRSLRSVKMERTDVGDVCSAETDLYSTGVESSTWMSKRPFPTDLTRTLIGCTWGPPSGCNVTVRS